MNTSMPPTTDTHQPWCDTEDACAGRSESGTHWGRRHVMQFDDDEAPGRDWPSLDELAVRATLQEGTFPILEIDVDVRTSGVGDLMWLTPAEGRRLAAAILAAADELDGCSSPVSDHGSTVGHMPTTPAHALTLADLGRTVTLSDHDETARGELREIKHVRSLAHNVEDHTVLTIRALGVTFTAEFEADQDVELD